MACKYCGEQCICSDAVGRRVSAPLHAENDRIPVTQGGGAYASSAASNSTSSSAQDATLRRYPEAMTSAQYEPEAQGNHSEEERWRQEVASRLNSYRARRRGKRDEQSMQLDFEAQQPAAQSHSAAHAAARQAVTERFASPEITCDTNFFRRSNASPAPAYDAPVMAAPPQTQTDYDPDFDFDAPRAAEQVVAVEPEAPSDNLIVFPKAPTYMAPMAPPAPPVYELAEPVLDQPRILEVAEEVVPTIQGSLFSPIQLDEEPEQESLAANAQVEFELPYQVALVAQRVYAGLIDWMFVTCGFGIFAAIVWKMVPDMPHTKTTLAFALVVPAVFWMVYQYMFITYAGQTPGMQMNQMSLSTFEGGMPNFERRRKRALSMIVSLMSGPMGFGWALLDADTLCWHDSMSRTYVTQQR